MSNFVTTIFFEDDEFYVNVDYDYQPEESGDLETPPVPEGITINSVNFGDVDIKDRINLSAINKIEQEIFDSFDEELQEPERDDEYMH